MAVWTDTTRSPSTPVDAQRAWQAGAAALADRGDGAPGASEHIVQFYRQDAFLLETLAEFVAAGLRADQSCLIVATPTHRARLRARLRARGVDLVAARRQRRYVVRDAGRTLAAFMANDRPDPARFADVFGRLIARMTRHAAPVRVFGEMVALLYAQGNAEAALRLEELWDELQAATSGAFTLLCGYPLASFAEQADEADFRAICQHHSLVLPEETYDDQADAETRMRAVSLLQQKAVALATEVERRKRIEAHLRAANQRLDDFIGVASHELRTPLTSAKLNVQAANRQLGCLAQGLAALPQVPADQISDLISDLIAQTTRAADLLSRANQQFARQERLVSDMLDLSRIRAGKLELRPAPHNLVRILGEVLGEQRLLYPARTLRLRVPDALEAVPVLVDADRISQVVTNYLTNALKYAPDDLPITVRLTIDAAGGCARVSVEDHGPGIPPEEHARLWTRFHRVNGIDVQSGSGIGLGLGLYICKSIVELHGGQVGLESAVGQGASFWFTLQLASASPATEQVVAARSNAERSRAQ